MKFVLPATGVTALVAAAVAAMLLAGCGAAPEEGGGPMGMPSAAAVPVITAQATAQSFTDTYAALGTVRANEAVEIRARISSVVTAIHFAEGQQVSKGALLVELDDREVAAELAVAQAALEKVRSQYQRAESLRATQVVSVAELDELAADLRKAEADVAAAQARFDHCTIRAPIAGVVGLRQVSPGGLVGTDTMITTLDDTREVKLDFAIPETFLAVVDEGVGVLAATTVYPDETFAGTITSIDSRIDPVTRSITVVATLPNTTGRLKPGMFMTVDLQRTRDNVLLIPEQALAPRGGRQFVFVVSDGKALEKEVALGVRAPGLVEVTRGLAAGDEVIIEGTQKVRSGAAITPSRAEG